MEVLGRGVFRLLVKLLGAWVGELLGVAVHLVKDVLRVVELLLLLLLMRCGVFGGVGHIGEAVVDGGDDVLDVELHHVVGRVHHHVRNRQEIAVCVDQGSWLLVNEWIHVVVALEESTRDGVILLALVEGDGRGMIGEVRSLLE